MNISYMGPEGSFSHAAAIEAMRYTHEPVILSPAPNIGLVIRAVADARVQTTVGVVPYYNFLEGLVQEHLDLIFEFQLKILGLIRLPVVFSAGTFDDPPAVAEEIYSHPKALAQVSDFIMQKFSNAKVVPVSSTSEAAQIVSEKRCGIAIASEAALKKFCVPIFAQNIGNVRHGRNNFTDFFIVQRQDIKEALNVMAPNHTMIAITPSVDRAGLLAELLGQFHFYDLDIAKIHSRPALGVAVSPEEPQMFYLEVKCAPSSEPLLRCIEAIRYKFRDAGHEAKAIRIMGSFMI